MNPDMNDLDAVMFLMQVVTTFSLTGIIWFLQLVHYPLMRRIVRVRFVRYERMHVMLTAFVIGPPVLLETVAVAYSLWRKPPWMDSDSVLLGAILLGLIWISTFLLQMPQHRVLQQGFDPKAYRRLLYSNWIRSYAWSFRTIILLFCMLRVFTAP